MAACPANAIAATGFSDAQILAQIEGLLRLGADGNRAVRQPYQEATEAPRPEELAAVSL